MTNNKCRITYSKTIRKNDWGEYVLKAWKDGKRYPNADYFTDDKQDAIDTRKELMKGCE